MSLEINHNLSDNTFAESGEDFEGVDIYTHPAIEEWHAKYKALSELIRDCENDPTKLDQIEIYREAYEELHSDSPYRTEAEDHSDIAKLKWFAKRGLLDDELVKKWIEENGLSELRKKAEPQKHRLLGKLGLSKR